jgi:hypothetical protein
MQAGGVYGFDMAGGVDIVRPSGVKHCAEKNEDHGQGHLEPFFLQGIDVHGFTCQG